MNAGPMALSQGVLEVHPKGFGFLRDPSRHFAPKAGDPYVGGPLISKFNLKQGLVVAGPLDTQARGNPAGPRLRVWVFLLPVPFVGFRP